jgi:hypothetical protein
MRQGSRVGPVAALAVTCAAALGGVLAALGPAGAVRAQEGGATISVQAAHPSSTSVHYFVELVDAGGEPVPGATVTAVPTSEDGTEGAPVTMTPGTDPGIYQGSVELSAQGSWTVTFSSSEPEASLTYPQDMPAEASGSVEEDDGGGSGATVVVVVLVVVVLLAFGAWALLGRRRPSAASEPDGPV